MNRELLDRFCARGILALVLAILVFGPLAMGAVDAWAFLVIQGLTLAVIALWALRVWLGPVPAYKGRAPLCWVVLAFSAYAIARYLTADIEFVARLQMIQVLTYGFLFFAIVENLAWPKSDPMAKRGPAGPRAPESGAERLRRGIGAEPTQIVSLVLIFLAAGISGYAVFQFLTHSNQVWNLKSPYLGRGMGTYISPNDFAGFLEMLLPLAVAYTLVGRVKPLVRALLVYAVAAMMAGIAVTLSRGGWVATASGLLALLAVLVSRPKHRLPALCLLVLLAAMAGVFVAESLKGSSSYAQRLRNPKVFTQLDWDVRRDMWGAAVHMWRDNFWFGAGPGLFDYRFPEYRPESLQMRPGWVHNDYLNLLADWGTVGGVIIFVGMGIFGASLMKTWKYVRPPDDDLGRGLSSRFAFFLGAASGLFALAVHSAVDFNLHIPANAIVGVTLLALLTGQLRFAERHPVKLQIPLKLLLTLALMTGATYLARQEWRLARAQAWLARAESAANYPPGRLSALKQAFAVEPMDFQTAYDIGEIYREQSFQYVENYADLAKSAMEWYARGMKLDPYDSYACLRYGMCLDWLGQNADAGTYFSRADALDPNGYFTAANIGWHYVQTGDFAAARSWLARSMRLHRDENVIASSYLRIAEQKLLDDAAQGSPLRPSS